MKSMQANGPRERWREALLGGLAGLGVPVLLLGMARMLGIQSGPATVGGAAGLVGALVGGKLARRTRERPELLDAAEVSGKERPASEPEPSLDEAPEPRRGPNGRERHWPLWTTSARTA
jgi:hypothetical protein